jgi:hypothetical protein
VIVQSIDQSAFEGGLAASIKTFQGAADENKQKLFLLRRPAGVAMIFSDKRPSLNFKMFGQ